MGLTDTKWRDNILKENTAVRLSDDLNYIYKSILFTFKDPVSQKQRLNPPKLTYQLRSLYLL